MDVNAWFGRIAGGTATNWAALLSVFAAVWWISAISLRNRTPKKLVHPQKLFRELCRAQRLTWREAALLDELADRRGLEHSAVIFVRPDYLSVEPDEMDAKMVREVAALREKLFGNLAESAPAQTLSPMVAGPSPVEGDEPVSLPIG